MQVTILELLPDSSGRLGGTGFLEVHDFDEIRDTTKIVLAIFLTREPLDSNGDCRVGLLL